MEFSVFGVVALVVVVFLMFAFFNAPLEESEFDVENYPTSRNSVVYLRETEGANCKHWESKVYYDAWGSPFVWNKDKYREIGLKPDGATTDWLYGTQWKLKSGPEVVFNPRPVDPFEDLK